MHPPARQLLLEAFAQHQAGKLAEAEALYRRVLEAEAKNYDAVHLLGVLKNQVGERAEARELLRRAVAIRPENPNAHYNLGCVLRDSGNAAEAMEAFRRTIELKPDYEDAHNNLAALLLGVGRFGEAHEVATAAERIAPRDLNMLANLAGALVGLGRAQEAEAACRAALIVNPNFAQAHATLGNALLLQRKSNEAVAELTRAIDLEPGLAEAHNNLSAALRERGDLEEALACAQRAVALQPRLGQGHLNLASALRDHGRIEESVAEIDAAVALDPSDDTAAQSRAFLLHYHPRFDQHAVAAAQREFAARFLDQLRDPRPHLNDRSPDRRLRVGYLSPDFREHPIGRMIAAVVEAHDRAAVEVFCYCTYLVSDEVRARVERAADHWRVLIDVEDTAAAEQIRSDGIDVLVDLAGYVAGNRAEVVVRKPAPAVLNHLCYPATTGLKAVDYRVSDARLDPASIDAPDKVLRLPHCYWLATVDGSEPAVSDLPTKFIFGSLNSPMKFSSRSIELFAAVLRAVEGSDLILLTMDRRGRNPWLLDQFGRLGISRDRVKMVPRCSRDEYLKLYGEVSLGLDTLPYNSHSTGIDSLLMGVPFVTLPGETTVGRAGESLLATVGLDQFIARSVEEYVAIAREWSARREELAELRAALRQRVLESPLADVTGYTRALEEIYRTAWRSWCQI